MMLSKVFALAKAFIAIAAAKMTFSRGFLIEPSNLT